MSQKNTNFVPSNVERMEIDLLEYIESHSTAEPELLARINRRTNVQLPTAHMLSGHIQGRVLAMLSRMICPQRILELGTFVGYSALCLAEGLTENGKLITIEKNDELEDLIRENLSQSPLSEKLELRIGAAQDVLRDLRKELREAGVQYTVSKNTLIRLAVAGTALEAMDDQLNGRKKPSRTGERNPTNPGRPDYHPQSLRFKILIINC